MVFETTFNQPNCTWTLPQILWLHENERETFEQIRHLLVSKDYILYQLTNEMVTDFGVASSTLMTDTVKREWSSLLVELSQLPQGSLPLILDSQEIVGTITREKAKTLGLSPSTKVVAGVLDSAAELLATGVINPKEGLIRLGTAGGIMVVTREANPSPGVLIYPHPIQPYWFSQGATNSCGSCLLWIQDILGNEDLTNDFQRNTFDVPPGSGGVLFHPYLMGERTPYWNQNLRGSFLGISFKTKKEQLLKAVLEGISFSLKDCMEYLEKEGYTLEALKIGGGGAKNVLWAQIICDILGRSIMRCESNDSALGSAFLVGKALGILDPVEIIQNSLCEEMMVYCDTDNYRLYQDIYRNYKVVIRDLFSIYQKFSNL